MLHYHPFSCHWSAKEQFLLPPSPFSTPAVSMEQQQKKQNPKPPGPTPSLFFTQDILRDTKPGNPAKNIEYEFSFYCSNQSEIYLPAMLKFTGHTIFLTDR